MVARIYQPAKTAMQSGNFRTRDWVLEFEAEKAKRIEPLMGWTSAFDMRSNQVRLRFPTCEEAIAFAEKHGLVYQVTLPRSQRRLLKAYSDNFRSDRTAPWTH